MVVTVAQGDATDALLDACEGADLLVVGNRGRGSFTQALLGSTSGKVSDRAPAPSWSSAPTRTATSRVTADGEVRGRQRLW